MTIDIPLFIYWNFISEILSCAIITINEEGMIIRAKIIPNISSVWSKTNIY